MPPNPCKHGLIMDVKMLMIITIDDVDDDDDNICKYKTLSWLFLDNISAEQTVVIIKKIWQFTVSFQSVEEKAGLPVEHCLVKRIEALKCKRLLQHKKTNHIVNIIMDFFLDKYC